MREKKHNSPQLTGSRDFRIVVLLAAGLLVWFSSFIHHEAATTGSAVNSAKQQEAIRAANLISAGNTSAGMRPFLFLPVPLNSADSQLLETIPGIGPRLAERIIALRNARQGFRDIDELLAVEGIGPQKFAAIRKFCSL